MSNCVDSKWVCVKTFGEDRWTEGKVYNRIHGKFYCDIPDKTWTIHPDSLSGVMFKEISFHKYYEQIHNLNRRKGK